MIFTERTITVVNDNATINKPLILYRGDKNIELKITIAESQFKFRNNDASNVIETTDASYAQLVINTPYNSPIFSDVAATKNGAVIFVITEAMIDEIREVGAYEIQIRLLDDNKQSRASIPPVSNAIEIREPIAIEDGSAVDSNAVNTARVNRALTTTSAPLEAFDSQGNYIKKTWGDGDPITDAALNKMEAGIDGVNKKIANNSSQIKENENERFIFNTHCLKNVKKDVLNIAGFGDSIMVGSGSDEGNYGFFSMLTDSILLEKRATYFLSPRNILNLPNTDWAKLPLGVGIPGRILYSISSAETYIMYEIPTESKLIIQYSTRLDGGEVSLYDASGNLIGSINSNGSPSDSNIVEFTIPANTRVKLCTTENQKFYLSGVFVSSIEGSRIYTNAVGGSKCSDYNLSSYLEYLDTRDLDLIIWEFITNDYSQNAYDDYVNITTQVVEKAKSLDIDVLFIIPCGQQGTTGNINWNKFKDFIYKISKEKECCLIDYDKYFGGYEKANRNNLLADSTHPNTKGYIEMANVICNLLIGKNSCVSYNIKPINYGAKKIEHDTYINNLYINNDLNRVTSNKYDWDHICGYAIASKIFNKGGNLPQKLPNGNLAIRSDGLVFYNSGNKENVILENAYCYPYIENFTSRPTPAEGHLYAYDHRIYYDINQYWTEELAYKRDLSLKVVKTLPELTDYSVGNIIILNTPGGDDVYMCLRDSSQSKTWKKINF